MSGIAGIIRFDGAPVTRDEVTSMTALLERRGPDGTGVWCGPSVGLGHTLLATTPEALLEELPLRDAASGCVITADVRLDNRAELLDALRLRERGSDIGDAGLILATYLAWGEDCVCRFLGDFAFAIWDPREQRLFCARDHFGVRPFYYHHTEHHFLAIASEPRAILVLPETPYRINEGRIADFLVSQLEGIDKTSTFFEEVYRLPPAHTLTATPEGVRIARYWTLEPGPELRLASDEEYAEAFLEVFTEAVRCRLRAIPGTVGSMLSGGMDSGSIVAVARQILAEERRGPLPTFSAVSPDGVDCVETRTIRIAQTMEGIEPHSIAYDQLDTLMPELAELTWNLDEPFDCHMTLVRLTYLAAHQHHLKVLLDGKAGDVVFEVGDYLIRLMQQHRWHDVYCEVRGQRRFWGSGYPAMGDVFRDLVRAFAPEMVRRLGRMVLSPSRVLLPARHGCRPALLDEAFAQKVDLCGRLRMMSQHSSSVRRTYRDDCSASVLWVGTAGSSPPGCTRSRFRVNPIEEHVLALEHPYLAAGLERYNRVASACAMESRDPFMDIRVVELCTGMPDSQKMRRGRPKELLRNAMKGNLDRRIIERTGKEHLGWQFTTRLMECTGDRYQMALDSGWRRLEHYVHAERVQLAYDSFYKDGKPNFRRTIHQLAHLSLWIAANDERRPQLRLPQIAELPEERKGTEHDIIQTSLP